MTILEPGEMLPSAEHQLYDYIDQKQISYEQEKMGNISFEYIDEYRRNFMNYVQKLNFCYENYLNSSLETINNSNLFTQLSNETYQEYFKPTKTWYKNDEEKSKEKRKKANDLITPYSSSVLAFNIFEYWRKKNIYIDIVKSLEIENFLYDGRTQMVFERPFKIYEGAGTHPHLDVCFENEGGSVIAIECKYTEPFREYPISKWNNFEKHYLQFEDIKIWKGLGKLRNFAKMKFNKQNTFFDVKQMLCHILGLLQNVDKDKINLVYLYQPSFLDDNHVFEREINEFNNILHECDIRFHSITWKKLLMNLLKNLSNNHLDYLKYNINRYL